MTYSSDLAGQPAGSGTVFFIVPDVTGHGQSAEVRCLQRPIRAHGRPQAPAAGRVLTDEGTDHYQKIVVALAETIRIMGEINEVIEKHGGGPLHLSPLRS